MKRKILYIIDVLNNIGGAEKNLYQVITKLDKNKYQPIVCCLKGGKLADEFSKFGFRLIELGVNRIYSLFAIAKIFRLVNVIRSEGVSLIVTYHESSDFLGIFLAKILHLPIITSKRDMGYNLNARHRIAFQILGKFYDLFITVSDSVKNEIVKINRVDSNKAITIHNGIDTDEFKVNIINKKKKIELGLRNDIPVIGLVAGLRKIKGIRYFLQAASNVLANGIEAQFIIIGNDQNEAGTSKKDLTELAKYLDISSYVYFLEGRNDIPECNAIMDIFVMSSLSEGFSNAILEAMAAGKPVIATNVGGNPEAVIHGETGLLVRPADPDSLSEAMLTLLKDQELAERMGEAGFLRVKEFFSLKKMISENENAYEMVLNRFETNKKELLIDNLIKFRWFIYQGIKIIIAGLFYYSRIINLFLELKNRRGKSIAKIFAFHNISNNKNNFLSLSNDVVDFEKLIKFLKENFKIVNLGNGVSELKKKHRHENIIVLTFDDSYKEFYSVILPILRKDAIPATFFISVNPIQSGIPLAIDLVIYAFANTQEKELDLRDCGLEYFTFHENYQKERVISKINIHLKKIGTDKDLKLIKKIYQLLKIDLTDFHQPNNVLNWNDIQQMKGNGISFGAHTLTHPNLTAISPEEAEKEIRLSKRIIEQNIGSDVEYFAYPYGSVENFNETIIDLVKVNGFRGAVTLVQENYKDDFQIPRTSISKGIYCGPLGNFSVSLTLFEISGLAYFFFLRFLKPKNMYIWVTFLFGWISKVDV